MVPTSLAASRLASNDVSSLADIFESTFHYYCTHDSPLAENYLRDIKILVGLGFTITLVDGDLLPLYQPRLNTFLTLCDFQKNSGALAYLSRLIAEMMDVATYLFQLKRYPGYYNDFALAMQRNFRLSMICHPEKTAEAKRLLPLLVPKEGVLPRETLL